MKFFGKIFAAVCVCCALILPCKMGAKTAAAAVAKNTAFRITATGTEEQSGHALYYVKAKDEVELSFDMLRNVRNGYFGVVFTIETGLASYVNRDHYTLFSEDAVQKKSATLQASEDFSFESGYAYKVNFSAAAETLTIARRALNTKDEFETKYSSSVKKRATGICGLALESDAERSATVIIDNLSIYANGKKVIESDFNSKKPSGVGFLKSSVYDSAEIFDSPMQTVTFMDINGKVLQSRKVCLYNYASYTAPKIAGKTFSHWSESVTDVRRDVAVYPIYKDGEEPVDPPDSSGSASESSSDAPVDSSSGDSSSGGTASASDRSCGSVFAGGFVALTVFAGVACILKKGGKRG